MNTMDALFSRKSVRSYTGEPVAEEELRLLLKAAYAAPVGRALYDTLSLTVVTNKDFMARLNALTGREALYGAPLMILVSSKLSDGDNNVAYSNAACIVENIALAAVELGLGTCHIWGAIRALNGSAELLSELPIPEGMTPCCAVIVGRTDAKYGDREIGTKIHTTYLK